MAKRSRARPVEYDERAAKLSDTAKDCRANGHDFPTLRDAIKEALRENKYLVNMRSIVVHRRCKRNKDGCGAYREEEFNTWTGETVAGATKYSDRDYLMPHNSGGRLPRADVRAAIFDDLFRR
jgi:hypothetical protein